MQFRVTMEACVAGNPLKAWKVRLPEGETNPDPLAPDRVPPDDVWESQVHEFATIDGAKDFVRSLPAETTTHVVLEYYADMHDTGDGNVLSGWVAFYEQDADAEWIDLAAPGEPMPHEIDSPLPFENDEVADAPPLMPTQGDHQ